MTAVHEPMTDTHMDPAPAAWVRRLILLTFALGATVAVSWLLFGGRAAFQGPDRVLERSWPAMYGSQALLAALVGAVLGRLEPKASWIVLLVAGAWLGELVALTLGGNILANELDPPVAWFYWWIGTGGPIQPLAAIAGGVAAGSLWRRGPAPSSSARTAAAVSSRNDRLDR